MGVLAVDASYGRQHGASNRVTEDDRHDLSFTREELVETFHPTFPTSRGDSAMELNGMNVEEGTRRFQQSNLVIHSECAVDHSRCEFHARTTIRPLLYLGVVEPVHRCLFGLGPLAHQPFPKPPC